MAQNLVFTEAANLLNAMFLYATYPAPTSPIKVALCTSAGTQSAAGAEVSGGGYARASFASTSGASSSTGTITTTSDLVYSNMPAVSSITNIDVYDSASTPRRLMTGALTTAKTTASGDTLTIRAGSFVAGLQN